MFDNAAMPAFVHITDSTLRDGLQNLKDWVPTELKKCLLDEAVAAGIPRLEVTSFVSPKYVPQMKDAAEIVAYAREKYPQLDLLVLVPNLHGARSAVEAGVKQVYQVISTSEEHNKANLNATRQKSLDNLSAIRDAYPDLEVLVSFSAVFGCPFVGENPIENVLWLAEEVSRRGVRAIALSDTIGVANPLHVEYVIKKVREAFPGLTLAMHLHDTHGMGLACSLSALRLGVDRFETAIGGLGGCPFAPGAAGNLSTEDLVNMLHRMGIKTGIDLEKLLAAAKTVRETVNPNVPGRLTRARPFTEFRFFDPAATA